MGIIGLNFSTASTSGVFSLLAEQVANNPGASAAVATGLAAAAAVALPKGLMSVARWQARSQAGSGGAAIAAKPLLVRAAGRMIEESGRRPADHSLTAGARTFFSNLTGTRNLTHTGDELLLPKDLQGVSFQGVLVNKAVAEQIVKNNGSLAGAILVGDFTNADLTDADLTGADLTGADLTGAILNGAVLKDAVLTGAVLAGARLDGADLTGAVLTGAKLQGAVLQGAKLQGAKLQGADLRGADLKGAVLQGAKLQGADLRDADLTGARLDGADLTGADFTGAYHVDPDNPTVRISVTEPWLTSQGANIS